MGRGERGRLRGLASLRAIYVLEGYAVGLRQAEDGRCQNQSGSITSHVFLAFKHYEAVAAVWLLFLVSLFVSMGITDNADLLRSAW